MTNPPLHSLSRSPYNTIRCRSSATQHMKNEQLLSPREAGDASQLWHEDTAAVTHALSSLIDLNDRVSKPPLRSTGESSQGVQGCQPEGLTFRLFGSGECEPPLEDRTRERVCNLLVDLRDRCPRRNYTLGGETKQASCVGGETRTRAGLRMTIGTIVRACRLVSAFVREPRSRSPRGDSENLRPCRRRGIEGRSSRS